MDDIQAYRHQRHPIRVVSERTGLSPDVLRAWERRHGVVTPARSDGGQRLYSDADIDRLNLLLKATEAGRTIGQVAALAPGQLAQLVAEDAEQRVVRPTPAGEYRERAWAEVAALAPERLRVVFREALVSLGALTFLDDVLAPLLNQVGDAWAAATIGVAHEHAASAVVRGELQWLLHRFEAPDAAPCVIVATVAGERHELGALLAAVAAAHDRWRVVYLGPDVPASDIAVAARRQAAAVTAVSIVVTDTEIAATELRALRQLLPSQTVLVAGGAGAAAVSAADDVTAIEDLTHWRRVLQAHAPAVRAR